MVCLKEKLKILHAPTTVGGNPQRLSEAEKFLGYDSCTLTLTQNYFQYKADIVISENPDHSLFFEFKRWKALLKSLKDFNVLHYNFGQTISPFRRYPGANKYSKWKVFLYSDIYCRLTEYLDLRIANSLDKVTAVTYQGDDARQGDYCRENYDICIAKNVSEDYYNSLSDSLKRARIKKVDKHADLIYALNPDLLNVLPKRTKFLPYASVDPKKWSYVGVSKDLERPHILHAPSNRNVKGTKFILQAFERLKADGIAFDYTLIENMSNDEACKAYERADLIIDQLLAGYYGGFAVECMALGKPVICYMREEDMHHLPQDMWAEMPIINTTPDKIYDTLKEWLTSRKGELKERGMISRKYVEKWHDPVKIARTVLDDYERVYLEKHGKK